MQSAKIVLDSISADGYRLTTFELRYPRWIHSELNTHRRFSRNASSSRAIPVSKLIQEVVDPKLRAMPVYYGKNQPGMSATEEMTDAERAQAEAIIEDLALYTAKKVQELGTLGLHKQSANRYLEPFTHINVVVSATEFMNFFGLRLDKNAQPEMKALADAMFIEYVNSEPKKLQVGQWHLPYVDETDLLGTGLPERIKISVARCARVSYRSFETGKRSTLEEDLTLYERLVGAQPVHASPAEHIATPDQWIGGAHGWNHPEEHGNFEGWRQWRKMIEGENMAPLPQDYKERYQEMLDG